MSYRLLAFDLDGTLLNDQKLVSAANAEALSRAAARGSRIVISSGRILPEARRCVQGLGCVSAISACNGALIQDLRGGGILHEEPMGRAGFEAAVSLLDAEGLFYMAYTREIVYVRASVRERYAGQVPNLEGMLCERRMVDDLLAEPGLAEGGVFKIFAMGGSEAECAKLRQLLADRSDLEVSSSGRNNLEITAAGVDKGKALGIIGRAYGVSAEETLAMGDGENDLSMLGYAGLPIAMGNADPAVLEMAKAVTLGNDEDGVAAALEEYVLG